jgi:Uma2 family endonuclease
MNLSISDSGFPVRLRFERRLTDDQLMRLSAENELLRIEREPNGELTVTSASGAECSGFETDVTLDLGIWARKDGRGKVFNSNAGFRLPDGSMRSPDAAWVSWARWNALTDKERKGYAPIWPEFVIEVRSEKDRLPPLQKKMLQWIANGVEVAWLIDPKRKFVAIYRPGEQPEIHENPTSVQGDGPVRGFELVLANFWD